MSLARRSALVLVALLVSCDAGVADNEDPADTSDDLAAACAACSDPDSASCTSCLGADQTVFPEDSPFQDPSVADVLHLTAPTLDFAIVGDTRPPAVDDTKAYPTAIIDAIWADIEKENPHPQFAVTTGDYQFSRPTGAQAGPQLDLYLAARAKFTGLDYPTMGNHECTGATVSNCGPGTTNGSSATYNAYLSKMVTPLGLHNPYYTVQVTNFLHTWTAKFVFVAANAWTPTQATWLDTALQQKTTYTFIVRHENSGATTAPGVKPSDAIIAKYPYTMLITGHTHTYRRYSPRQVIIGNGGAPLTTGSGYGYGIAQMRADGAIVFTTYRYDNHAVLGTFAVKADGTATN